MKIYDKIKNHKKSNEELSHDRAIKKIYKDHFLSLKLSLHDNPVVTPHNKNK